MNNLGFFSKRPRLVLIGLLAGLQIVAWGLFVSKTYDDAPGAKPVAAVRRATNECKSTDTTCQQEARYRALTEQSGVAAAFAELRAQYAADDSVRSNCHPLTHVIGRTAGQKFATVSAAYAEGDEFCWSGYYHGVMEAMLSKIDPDEMIGQLNTICADVRAGQQFSFDHYNCVHGLGHGVMLVSQHELFESLTACDNLDDSWERESCYGGVFMENVMASINPAHTTKYIIADQPLYPCTAVEDSYKQQCYLMQTSQALTSLNGDFEKVFQLCAGIEKTFQATCFQSLGRDASGRSISNAIQTRDTCSLGKEAEAVTNCTIGAVKDFVSYYHSDTQALEYCDLLEPTVRNVCMATAKDYYATF